MPVNVSLVQALSTKPNCDNSRGGVIHLLATVDAAKGGIAIFTHERVLMTLGSS